MAVTSTRRYGIGAQPVVAVDRGCDLRLPNSDTGALRVLHFRS